MASYTPSKKPKPIEIKKFLGINASVGETEIKLGEATNMRNFRITKNYKPKKRDGHNTFLSFDNSPVRSLWYGILNETKRFIIVHGGKVYEYETTELIFSDDLGIVFTDTGISFTDEITEIGTLTDAQTSILYFNDKLYFMNGTEYKEYDGTTFKSVDGYIPTITIATPPSGGGTLFEEVNLLTGYKTQAFIGNNTTTYTLAEQGLDALAITATVNGVAKVETTNFTVNRTTGVVTFLVAPPNESEVTITYSKTTSGLSDLVLKNRFMMKFGPSNNTNVFIWGNPEYKNVYRVSGTLRPDYFPANSFYAVSTNDYAITDIQPQNDRILIFKENMTHYSYPQENGNYADNTGLNAYVYPSYDLNEAVGNICHNGVQVVKGLPVSLYANSVWEWKTTEIKDERNCEIISDRIKEFLLEEDLSEAITYDYQSQKELWINIGEIVYIWNYGNDTWYIYDNIEATCFIEIENTLFYGSKEGTIEAIGRFTKDSLTNAGLNDNNTAIYAIIELGFTDFEVNYLTKSSRRVWITLQPYTRTSLTLNYETDEDILDSSNEQSIFYYFLDFENVDFNYFPFTSNPNPHGEQVKIRAKKYQYIRFVLENNELNQELTILNLLIQAETKGYVK